MKQPAGTSIGIVKPLKWGTRSFLESFQRTLDTNLITIGQSPVTVIAAVEDLVHNAAENCVFDCSEDKSERRDTLIV